MILIFLSFFLLGDGFIRIADHIMAVNREHNFGLKHVGLRALGSLRQEKAYKDYGHDMDNTDTIAEVGLGFTCDCEKTPSFVGADAVQAFKARPDQQQVTRPPHSV